MARVGFKGLSSTEGKKQTFSPLDPAWYDTKIIEAAYKEFGDKKTPGLNYCAEVVDGPTQKDGTSPIGKKIYGTVWLPKDDDEATKWENKLANLKAFLEITDTPIDGDDFDSDKVVGGEIALKVKHRVDDKGETRAEVQDYAAIGQGR